MARRADLLATAGTGRVLAGIRWIEMWMVKGLRDKAWNAGGAVAWLLSNPNPMFYTSEHAPSGGMRITCAEGMTIPKLKISYALRIPDGYSETREITQEQWNNPAVA